MCSSEIVPKSVENNRNKLHVPCPLDVVVSCPASLSWSAPQTELSPSKQLSPLSKVEQKRLQWQRERGMYFSYLCVIFFKHFDFSTKDCCY